MSSAGRADDTLLIELLVQASGQQFASSLPIVLTVGGCTIAGELISRARFIARYKEKLAAALPKAALESEPQIESVAAAAYGEEAASETGPAGPAEDAPALAEGRCGFVHIENARIYAPAIHRGSTHERIISIGIPVDGLLWRGRLEDVSGFAIGRLEQG